MRPHAFVRFSSLAAFLLAALLASPAVLHGQAAMVSAEEREAFHRDPLWLTIAPHLPDPHTGSAASLETAGDVLRARRFPQDALDYYGYALARGGSVSGLLNKMGVVRLELRQTDLARELFIRTVRAKKNDPQGWNNLGVTDYIAKNYHAAITEYRRASRLDRTSAVYHSNLGMAYFESGDMESARNEFSIAVRLDPQAFERGNTGGSTAHIIGTQNYGQLAFEMARVYARQHDDAATMLWLAKATEAGFEIKPEMSKDTVLRGYLHDVRITVMLKNAQQLKMRSVATSTPAPSLGEATERRVD